MKIFEVAMSVGDALKVLGLTKDELGDADALKRAYRKASLTNHPDAGGSNEAMLQVNAAHEVLKNRSASASGQRFDWDDHKQKHEQIAKVVLADLQTKFDPEVFKAYFEKTIGKTFTYDVKSKLTVTSYYGYANITAEFTSDDKKTMIDIRYQVSTQGVDVNKNYLGLAGMTLPTYVNTSVLHNLRKFKMKQRDYEFTQDATAFTDPSLMFPRAKLLKMVSNTEQRKVAKRDFILAFEKELGMKRQDNDFYNMPLGGDLRLLVYRMTLMRQGAWSINGIYEKHKRVAMGPTVTFHEDADTLDYMVEEFAKLKGMTDLAQIEATLEDIAARYKEMKASK